MASVSKEIPKALLPVRGKPVLDHQLEKLTAQGFSDFIFCVGHLGDQIAEHVGDGSRWNAEITIQREQEPLGTGGPIAAAAELLCGEPDFLVVFGDILFDMDVAKLVEFHRAGGAMVTFAVHQSDHPEDSSNVVMDAHGRVESVGRPQNGHPLTGITRTSIQVLNASVLDEIPAGRCSLEDDVIPALIARGETVMGYYTEEFVKDMGTPERYRKLGGQSESA